MDQISELGTARGFAQQRVQRALRELSDARAELGKADKAYFDYLNAPHCRCGGMLGPRVPGNEEGLGCLENIYH